MCYEKVRVMAKVSRRQENSKDLGHYINNLWSAFTLMDSKEDIRILFRDLFTHTEYKMLAKRLEIARRLLNEESYEQIIKDLKVTARTITVISNTLAIKGEGLRKTHDKLLEMEGKYQKYQEERQKRWERRSTEGLVRKSILGQVLKAGIKSADKAIAKKRKKISAKQSLSIE
ncbi:MAG: hypothetical protein COT91_01885 [Candidatus Doudnabacteria bacterium CG10_big_fil_rev_8_21_14_0_10_41_10]|uniref:Uncharacterized protein n=1 Tax=Candidatus Doudnabacteria bacterium CG10_big_fil_rev_8_21_14_0_10_41_10 TaxID=1974551 RepID=A0A2H0VE26_9BACT|nr:MAG: hypothetical protein COT91_01885 [Candidatus Doudnabacteria bacterium CG10_big_fil_rev_8_21_14_0_10_41_10]